MKIAYDLQEKLPDSEQKLVDDEWVKTDRAFHGKDYDKYEWQKEYVITARKDEQLLGIARIAHEGGVMWLEELLVFDGHRGQGIGSGLLERVIDEAKTHGCHKVILETDRPEAIKLYKKFGFETEATLKNHYLHKDGVILTKFI